MMDEFATMWDNHLEQVVAAKHWTDLTEMGKMPLHEDPYRAAPRHRKS